MSIEQKKIKCLMVVPSMGNGGAERVLATMANELIKKEYELNLLTLTSDESFYQLDPSVKIIGANYKINRKNKIKEKIDITFFGLKSIFFLKRQIKKNNPDIILSFLTHTNIISLVIHLFYRNIPLIISERAEPRLRSIAFKVITKYLYPAADLIVCQSHKVTEFFPKYAQKKMRVVFNPINADSIPTTLPAKRRKTIVGVGRLFPQKNFSLLIESFKDVRVEFPEYTLEIYGEGPLRNELQNKIDSFGLSDHVFLMGVKKDVMNYIYDAELFVMSSNFEGFPNALVEAMASGLPVISTDFSTGIANELIKKENGIVVPLNDKSSMTEAIKKMLSNKKMRFEMSNENRKIIEKLNQKKIVDEWDTIFKDTINNKRKFITKL